jgi:hypothetical protein
MPRWTGHDPRAKGDRRGVRSLSRLEVDVAVTARSEVLGRLPVGDGGIHGAARYPK